MPEPRNHTWPEALAIMRREGVYMKRARGVMVACVRWGVTVEGKSVEVLCSGSLGAWRGPAPVRRLSPAWKAATDWRRCVVRVE